MRAYIKSIFAKGLNTAAISLVGLNGGSFSAGKIDAMKEIANLLLEAEGNKSDILTKLHELGKHASTVSNTVVTNEGNLDTRSAVVMAVFMVFSMSGGFGPVQDIDVLNKYFEEKFNIRYNLIANNYMTNKYFKEAIEFIKNDYKTIHGNTKRHQLHEIFSSLSGTGVVKTYFPKTETSEFFMSSQNLFDYCTLSDERTPFNIQQFLITVHKYPNKFTAEEIKSLFKKLPQDLKISIAILVYRDIKYLSLCKLLNFSNNLTKEERIKARELIFKGVYVTGARVESTKKLEDDIKKASCERYFKNELLFIPNYNAINSTIQSFNNSIATISKKDKAVYVIITLDDIISYLYSKDKANLGNPS